MINHVALIKELLDTPREVCAALGIIDGPRSFQRQARGVIVRCPAHDEKTPSCSVQNKGGVIVWNCHGCDASGDVLDLVAAVHRLDAQTDFPEVLRIAGELCGVRIDDTPPAPRQRPERAPIEEEVPPLDDDRFGALADILARRRACDDPEVAAYLRARGLLEIAGTTLWSLGGLHQLRAEIIDTLGADAWKRSGLARADGTWSWTDHRLLIPWAGPGVDADVYQFQRRAIREGIKPKYIKATGRTFRYPFGIGDALEERGPESVQVFVEGALDCLAYRALVRREGLDRVVVGLPGVRGWRSSWAKLARGRVAVLALDGDAAGEAAVAGIADDLRAAGAVRVLRARVVGAKDWAEKYVEVA